MGIFDKIWGGQKPEEKIVDGQEGVEGGLPPVEPFEDGSDTADGDGLSEPETAFHDFESVLRAHPELRPENKGKDQEGQK